MGIVYIIKSSFTKVSVVILTQCRGPDQSCLAAKVISNPTACVGEKDFLSWDVSDPLPRKPKLNRKEGVKSRHLFHWFSIVY